LQGEPSEKCGELNFGLDYDFSSQTLKLKIIQVRVDLGCVYKRVFAVAENAGDSKYIVFSLMQ
jgi:hypothetical protein